MALKTGSIISTARGAAGSALRLPLKVAGSALGTVTSHLPGRKSAPAPSRSEDRAPAGGAPASSPTTDDAASGTTPPTKTAPAAKKSPPAAATPEKKATPTKKSAAAKKSTPAKKSVPAKKSAPAKKATPAKKAATKAPAAKKTASASSSADTATGSQAEQGAPLEPPAEPVTDIDAQATADDVDVTPADVAKVMGSDLKDEDGDQATPSQSSSSSS